MKMPVETKNSTGIFAVFRIISHFRPTPTKSAPLLNRCTSDFSVARPSKINVCQQLLAPE
jgi:hypothetical protein